MVVPSPSCLRTYVRKYKSGFGFNEEVLTAIAEKARAIDPYHRHGGTLVDEVKLSESLTVNSKGQADGFVDLGKYSLPGQEGVQCDYGLVILFEPFTGKWQQILGVFGARNNVKADILAKIIVDAVICAEKSGLFVDFVTCDGAAWNHCMWRIFSVSGKLKTVCKVKHPVDTSRYWHFLSDFPYLVKCMHNAVTSKGLIIPDGRVGNEYIKEACKCDTSSSVTLTAMPHVTMAACQPNGFEKCGSI